MQFCKKCGSLMMPKRKEDGTVVLICPRCNYEQPVSDPHQTVGYVRISDIKHKPSERITVIEEELPVGVKVKTRCPKCGYHQAYYWEVQTRSADEPATGFFKCVRCGYVWREYQ